MHHHRRRADGVRRLPDQGNLRGVHQERDVPGRDRRGGAARTAGQRSRRHPGRARPAGDPPVNEDLSLLDATAQAELVRTGQVGAAELVTAAIERIEALNPVLNAVVTPVFERAAEAARDGPAGPFAGVPYLVKDLACEMEGVRFTEGSRFLADNVSAFDSEIVLRLRRAGLGDPYWAPPPARPFLAEVGADPGRLRIGFTVRTPEDDLGHPDCVAAAEHAARLCSSLGHEVTETDWPGFSPEVGAAIGTMISAAAAWIMRYWIRHLGREPGTDEIEPLNRALWQAGEQVTAAQWLLAVGDIQRFSRRVARFFTGFDAFLTPTMSSPPLPIGTMVSTPEDPWRSLQVSGQSVRYAGVVANLTGNPAMSVPLWWNDEGLPIGVHVLGRFGDEATLIRLAAQLEAAQPWAGRRPLVHAARPREP